MCLPDDSQSQVLPPERDQKTTETIMRTGTAAPAVAFLTYTYQFSLPTYPGLGSGQETPDILPVTIVKHAENKEGKQSVRFGWV